MRVYITGCEDNFTPARNLTLLLKKYNHHVILNSSKQVSSASESDRARLLSQADLFIVLMTDESFSSASVYSDVQLAKQSSIPVIGIKLAPLSFNTSGRLIDATEDPSEAVKKLLKYIHFLEHSTQDVPTKPPQDSTREDTTRIKLPISSLSVTMVMLVVMIFLLGFLSIIFASSIPTSSNIGAIEPTVDSIILSIDEADPTAFSRQVAISYSVNDIETDSTVTAKFSAYPVEGIAPLSVEFLDESEGNTIVEYAWDYDGDGVTDSNTTESDSFIYEDSGSYTAILTVYDEEGNSNQSAIDITVFDIDDPTLENDLTDDTEPTTEDGQASDNDTLEPEPVVASMRVSTLSGNVPLTVNFRNTTSGEYIDVEWDLNGDGNIDSNAPDSATYIYDQPGEYIAQLIVIDNDGIAYNTTNTIFVAEVTDTNATRPIAQFEPSTTAGDAPLTITFTDTSFGDINQYRWDFNGDGSVDSNQASSTSYTYTQPGIYNASLVVVGPGGASDPEVATIVVYGDESNNTSETNSSSNDEDSTSGDNSEIAIAALRVEPTEGTAPLIVQLFNETPGVINSVEWDFDNDGVTDSTDMSLSSYTFDEPGTYDITLTVNGEDLDGGPITTQAYAYVDVYASDINGQDDDNLSNDGDASAINETLFADFTMSVTEGNAPLSIQFTNISQGAIQTYQWDFDGDGVVDSTDSNPPPYTYQQAGVYSPSLEIIGVDGSDKTTSAVRVYDDGEASNDLSVVMSANVNQGVVPLTVQFASQTTGNVTNLQWDFNGDGVVDHVGTNPPPFTYTQARRYTAAVIVTDAQGQSRIGIQTIQALAPIVIPPTSTPVPTNTPSSTPIIIQTSTPLPTLTPIPTSTPTLTPTLVPVSGVSSTPIPILRPISDTEDEIDEVEAPTLTYTPTPTFTLTHTHTPTFTPTPTPTLTHTPLPPPPTAVMTASTTSILINTAVQFSSVADPSITDYRWDFNGDGTIDAHGLGPHTYTYTVAGTYTAQLTVSGPGGPDANTSQVITVTEPAPEPEPAPIEEPSEDVTEPDTAPDDTSFRAVEPEDASNEASPAEPVSGTGT